jgi:hypothetical protein
MDLTEAIVLGLILVLVLENMNRINAVLNLSETIKAELDYIRDKEDRS